MALNTHTLRPRLEEQLADLRAELLAMGFETEDMLRDAVAALTGEGPRTGEAVLLATEAMLDRDDRIDAIEARIESECVQVLSLQQPVVSADLRLILTVLKAANNVERIGDHAVSIIKTVRRMQKDGVLFRPLVDIGRLSEMTRQMLHDSLEALVHSDVVQAQAVIDADIAVDKLYSKMRKDLQSKMEADPTVVRLAASLLFVIHYLERISDRATNIAEQMLYLDSGQLQPVGRRERRPAEKPRSKTPPLNVIAIA